MTADRPHTEELRIARRATDALTETLNVRMVVSAGDHRADLLDQAADLLQEVAIDSTDRALVGGGRDD